MLKDDYIDMNNGYSQAQFKENDILIGYIEFVSDFVYFYLERSSKSTQLFIKIRTIASLEDSY